MFLKQAIDAKYLNASNHKMKDNAYASLLTKIQCEHYHFHRN
jgi:hypothetical protein